LFAALLSACALIESAGALSIHGGLPPNDLNEFIACAKQHVGKLH